MHILFSIHITNKQNANTCNAVVNLLTKQGNTVFVVGKQTHHIKSLEKHEIHSVAASLKHERFDLALAYSASGIRQVKEIAREKGIPVVGLVDPNDFANKYIGANDAIDKILLLNPSVDYPRVLIQPDFIYPISLPEIKISSKNYQIKDTKRPCLLVVIEEETVLYSPAFQLISGFNKLVNSRVTLVSGHRSIKSLINPNIKIISREKAGIEQLINQADIVIASGRTAEKAIAQNKPVIIAGERGYGGLLTGEQFEQQVQNQFQGRIGGEIGELIPERLLMNDLLDLLEWGNERVDAIVKQNRSFLKKKVAKEQATFIGILQETANRYNLLESNIGELNLRLSAAWQLVPLNKGKYLLSNARTGQVHSHFEAEEAAIIELFRESFPVKKALRESGYEEEPELFIDFIRDLLNEKILVIDGNS